MPKKSPQKRGRSKSSHHGSASAAIRRRVEAGGERFWRYEDFAGLPPAAVAKTLSRLAKEGELDRVSKGVYYRTRPTRFGPSLPAASAVAANTLRAALHPAGLTAANALGFTTQNPARLEYATSASDRPSALPRAQVATRRPQGRNRLTREEGAMLEFLRDRGRTSDLSPARTKARLLRLLRDPDRFARLVRAAADEPPRVRAMLGAAGEEIRADSRLLQQLRRSLNPLSRFDFGYLGELRHARKWQAKMTKSAREPS